MTDAKASALLGFWHLSVAEISANCSGRTPLANRVATYPLYSAHLHSSVHCMAPARKLPHDPKRAPSAGGDRAKAEEGEVNQAPQEAWCNCHSPLPCVPALAV